MTLKDHTRYAMISNIIILLFAGVVFITYQYEKILLRNTIALGFPLVLHGWLEFRSKNKIIGYLFLAAGAICLMVFIILKRFDQLSASITDKK